MEFRVAASRLTQHGASAKEPGSKNRGQKTGRQTRLKERPDSRESTDARAALPQNCSLVRLLPLPVFWE